MIKDKAISVLVVDDEALVRLATKSLLEDAGMMVVEASNYADAIAILETSQNIDVLLTDIRMPGELDGLALATFTNERWSSVKVMVISGDRETTQSDIPTGVRFFAKPYESRQLIATIQGEVLGYAG